MKVKKEETIETNEVAAKLGTITERDGRLHIQLKTCNLTIEEDEISIEFNVRRLGHDHDNTSTMTIKGLHFVDDVSCRGESKSPLLIFSDRWRPEIKDVDELLGTALWALEDKNGKLYGQADLRATSRLLLDAQEFAKKYGRNPTKDDGKLVIHAYLVEEGNRHPQCVDIIGTRANLDLLLPMINFKLEKTYPKKKK